MKATSWFLGGGPGCSPQTCRRSSSRRCHSSALRLAGSSGLRASPPRHSGWVRKARLAVIKPGRRPRTAGVREGGRPWTCEAAQRTCAPTRSSPLRPSRATSTSGHQAVRRDGALVDINRRVPLQRSAPSARPRLGAQAARTWPLRSGARIRCATNEPATPPLMMGRGRPLGLSPKRRRCQA